MDAGLRRRIIEKIKEFEDNPFPRGSIKLRGEKDAYRVRIGDYRVLYKILWEKILYSCSRSSIEEPSIAEFKGCL